MVVPLGRNRQPEISKLNRLCIEKASSMTLGPVAVYNNSEWTPCSESSVLNVLEPSPGKSFKREYCAHVGEVDTLPDQTYSLKSCS